MSSPALEAPEPQAEQPRTPVVIWVILVLVVVVALLLGFLLGQNSAYRQIEEALAPTSSTAPAEPDVEPETTSSSAEPLADGTYDAMIVGGSAPVTSPETIQNVHRRDAQDPFALGELDAPVVMSLYSDFGCPHCASFANDTLPQVVAEYVDEGLLRIEWNDMPVTGEEAVIAAAHGRAAAEQGRFFEFASLVYENADQDELDYTALAEEASVPDMEKFAADAGGNKYADVLTEAIVHASELEVTGTPTVIIGAETLVGAQPFEAVSEVIEAQLDGATVAV